MYGVSFLLQLSQYPRIRSTGQRRLKREILATPSQGTDLVQHEPTGVKGRILRRKRRQSLRDEVGIDEVYATNVMWQELASERRLSRSIRTGHDIDIWCAIHAAFPIRSRLGLSPQLPVQTPVLHRLRDVLWDDRFRSIQVGDRAGEFEDTVVGTGGKVELVNGGLEQLSHGFANGAKFLEVF